VLGAAGITVSAPVVVAIAAGIAVTALVVFLSDANNRAWLAEQITGGMNDIKALIDQISSKVESDTIGGTPRNVHEAKQSRRSGKDRGSDIPSWAKGAKRLPGEKPSDTAKRLLDEKYGPGNWKEGPDTEYNQLKKFYERNK
jgi:hypothetical protein